MLISVVLPAPLCPNKTKISFLNKSKVTPSNTFFSPNFFLILHICRISFSSYFIFSDKSFLILDSFMIGS